MKKMKMGFDIVLEKGSLPRPQKVKAWTNQAAFAGKELQSPFKYNADLLMGLSLVKLNPSLHCPVVNSHSSEDCHQIWQKLDPHVEMWKRSRPRVNALALSSKKTDPKFTTSFEKQFADALNYSLKPDGVELADLWTLIDSVTHFEEKNDAPLIYNFGISFSKPFTEKLHSLYSFLFHLRSVVAIDWNAHVEDPSHEALKIDSISDYLPKPEYVAHDAVLYWNFMKLAKPWTHGKQSDVRIEKLFVQPLDKAFHAHVHNACYLINNLPTSFVEGIGPSDLEHALHLVQMDWLLGSDAGLLFRIREELYALQDGYDKIFWPDYSGKPVNKKFDLSIAFEYHPQEGTNKKVA